MTDAQLQQKRLAAAGIDVAILFALYVAMGLGGVVMSCLANFSHIDFLAIYGPGVLNVIITGIGLVYTLARDVVVGDRSLGKKLMNIRVVRTSGEPIGVVDSVKRNGIFALGTALSFVGAVLGLIPFAGGCIRCLLLPVRVLAGLVALAAAVWEIVQITSQPEGTRMGDNLAGTRVTW